MGQNKVLMKKKRALESVRKRQENRKMAEKKKEEELLKMKKEEEKKEEMAMKKREHLRRLQFKVHQLQRELKRSDMEKIELNRRLKITTTLLGKCRDGSATIAKKVEDQQLLISDQQKEMKKMSKLLSEKLLDDTSSEISAQKEEIEERKKRMDEIQKKTEAGARLKPFGELVKKESRRVRCKMGLDYFKKLVGTDVDTLDSFIFEFINMISESKEFAFSLKLSDWDSYYASIRWNLSVGFIKDFQKFCKEKLGFGVIASMDKIRKIKKLNTVQSDYRITVDSTIKTTKSGKTVTSSTATAGAKDVSKMIARRLEHLHNNGRLIIDEGENVVLGFGGDKGADTTKLVVVLENVEHPNDPHGILLIGVYNGHDNHSNLKSKLGYVFDQINKLKSITYREGEATVTRNITIMPVGDCRFISAMYDHAGQSSIEPCFRCKIRYNNHGKNKATLSNLCFEKCGDLRTIEQMKNDGKNPLLEVEPSNAAPPGLHVFIGVSQHYFVDWMIALAVQLDFKEDALPIDLKQQRKHLKMLNQESMRYLHQLNSLHSSLKSAEDCQSFLSKFPIIHKSNCHNHHKCQSPYCLADANPHFPKNSDTFRCKCGKEFHMMCELHVDSDDSHRLDSLRCLDCLYGRSVDLADRLETISDKFIALQSEYDNILDVRGEVVQEELKLEQLLDKSSGPTRQKLEALFQSMGCDHRVWYQEMTGNQTRTLLRPENITRIFDMFQSELLKQGKDTDLLELMCHAMNDLAFLMSQADNAKKTDEEIDLIEEVMENFVSRMRQLHPNTGVTTKLHLLTAHLVEHLREHHSWGRVSEQGIESLHGVMNKLEIRFSSIRNVKLHTLLILEQFSHYNTIFDIGSSW